MHRSTNANSIHNVSFMAVGVPPFLGKVKFLVGSGLGERAICTFFPVGFHRSAAVYMRMKAHRKKMHG
jgi:capsid portal protein